VLTSGARWQMQLRGSTAAGEAVLTIWAGSDGMECRYHLVYEGPEVSVREIGLAWLLRPDFSRLSWKRRGQWTAYPKDHIGRLAGSALASPDAGAPVMPWPLLRDPRGSNDFRSTKYNVVRASLTNAQGVGFGVGSDGSQAVRASVEQDAVVFRVLDFSNGGGEGFLRGHYADEYRTLKPGDVLEGGAVFRLVKAPER